MSSYIPVDLRNCIEQADRDRCCYCLTQSVNSGIPLAVDHILPRVLGGATTFENVCLVCRPCNEFKSVLTEAVDPLTGEPMRCFTPGSSPGRIISVGVRMARVWRGKPPWDGQRC